MWRFALLCSVLTLTAACADGPAAPTMNTDGLSLVQEGDPPPPPLDGSGRASFGSEEGILATEIVTQQDCEFPPLSFDIVGDYFRNNPENLARVNFTPEALVPTAPDPGTGTGTIHETANPSTALLPERQDASGTLVVIGSDGQQYEVHLLDYRGTSLFDGDDSFGSIFGPLDAVVMGCGERRETTGFISFSWGVDD
jgi:hypothetical protein